MYTALTDREKNTLLLAGKGYSNREIGRELCFSEKTIKNIMSDIYDKLQVSGNGGSPRTRAVVKAMALGLIPFYFDHPFMTDCPGIFR